jgi:hypothetical protein
VKTSESSTPAAASEIAAPEGAEDVDQDRLEVLLADAWHCSCWGLEQRREIDSLELNRGGEHVALGVRGPNIGPAEEPLGQIFNVFTLRDGRIVRIHDYRGRREAFAAAGVAEDTDWS